MESVLGSDPKTRVSVGCGFRIFAVNIQVLSGRQHGETTSSSLVRTFTTPRAASPHLIEEKLGVNVTTHHNRAIPDSRVYLSYCVTLESPVNQKTVEYKTRQQNMELPTGLSVRASCKPACANMLPVPLVGGEFHFEDLTQ